MIHKDEVIFNRMRLSIERRWHIDTNEEKKTYVSVKYDCCARHRKDIIFEVHIIQQEDQLHSMGTYYL